MNFVLGGMTFLRYFVPVIIAGNKLGLKSRLFWMTNKKYNNAGNFVGDMEKLSKEYNFELYGIDKINDYCDTTFFVEGDGLKHVKYSSKKICLTSMQDFSAHYDGYIKCVDRVVFCSRFFAEHYGKVSEKNLYIGSPKYDVKFEKNIVMKKYGLPNNAKISLIIFPLQEHLKLIDLNKIYHFLHKMGYFIVVKTRGKNKAPPFHRGDRYFEDFSWFPHTTMELIYASDIVVNFTSGTIKECLMANRPTINFDTHKPESEQISFLYNNPCCLQISSDVRFQEFRDGLIGLVNSDLTEEYYKIRDKYLFQPTMDISKRILDAVL